MLPGRSVLRRLASAAPGAVPSGAVLQRFRCLPDRAVRDITLGRPLLVLAPHPDDESLGCGGLIAAARAEDTDVHVAILTDGTGSHPRSRRFPALRLKAVREEETRQAVAELGLLPDRLSFMALRDTAAPRGGAAMRDAAARVAAYARAFGISTVCTTWVHDPHGDHVAAYRIGRRAARAAGARLLSYPVWGWTLPAGRRLRGGPASGVRLDVRPFLAAKRRAIACHRSQVSDLIADDPTAFRLSERDLARMVGDHEVFLDG